MVRQKVKGTGHKQPADASSEPNFYRMPQLGYHSSQPPLSPSPQLTVLPPPQPSAKAGPPEPEDAKRFPTHGFVVGSSVGESPVSPGMRSVHGAAHLLRGIASGLGFPRLPPTSGPSAFLGTSVEAHASSATSQNPEEEQDGDDEEPSSTGEPPVGKVHSV